MTRCLLFILMLSSGAISLAQVEFRVVGGPGIERGEIAVPHADGVFLVASSKVNDSNVLKGYVVHYNQDLNVEWSTLLSSTSPQETVVDAWSDSPGQVSILTSQLHPSEGLRCAIHTLDASGNLVAYEEPSNVPLNFRPVTCVDWQGDPWLIGSLGSQPSAINLVNGDTRSWGGLPGTLDEIADAIVANDVLVAVGSRQMGDVTSTAIWGLYPLGQYAYEIVDPDPLAGDWSQAVAVDQGESVIRVLHNFRPESPDDDALLYSLVSVIPETGELTPILYSSFEGERPGTDLIWTPQGWINLSTTDAVLELDHSILVTHYSEEGAYQSQGVWGTAFEEVSSRLSQGDDGVLWAAGSTRGALDGSWNACLLRFDSVGHFGNWATEGPGYGVYDDPVFDQVSGLHDSQTQGQQNDWTCQPNPASTFTMLKGPSAQAEIQSTSLSWFLHDSRGRLVLEGHGPYVELAQASPGMHHLLVRDNSAMFRLPLMVEKTP